MSFIVKKKIHGHEYYYLNENKRVDGKVKTKTIAYLGKTKSDAKKKAKEILANLPKRQPKDAGKKAKEIVKKRDNEKTKSGSKITLPLKDRKKEVLVSTKISVEDLANFCKRKGFVFKSSDIYGGFYGFWDFGPLVVELIKNIKK
jgi:hypothetical protein